MNETLSINQANQMMRAVDDELQNAATDVNIYSNRFYEDVSKVWEDKNATDFAKDSARILEEIITNLEKNKTTMLDTINDIAIHYATVGGISDRPNIITKVIRPDIDTSVVKEYFSDGNGDDFGFKNIDQGPIQVMEAFRQYKTQMNNRASELASRMSGINAFGNTQVSMELTKSAGKIITILKESLEKVEKIMQTKVDDTAKSYKRAGNQATDSFTGIRDGAKEVSEKISDFFPEKQKLYGPPPGVPGITNIPDMPPISEMLPHQKLYGPAPGVPGITNIPDMPPISEMLPHQKLYAAAPAPFPGITEAVKPGKK